MGQFPLLSHGATEALGHYGDAWQKEVFLKRLVSGEWTGTMCLTEPHCGTDLGLLKTKAVPNGDGSHSISGTKIFITAGEHDMAGNIVHLVLARLPDAPAGSKGISMFIVPKLRVDADGNTGERNGVRCGSIEHKMGIHGSATCVMNFDAAQGWLVGEANKGLVAMFVMMNTARLAVGLQGLGLADRALQNALRYARERLQSRSLTGAKFPDKPADPIIVQPDVRRMLLTQKALVEGGRLLGYHAASLVDVVGHAQDAGERRRPTRCSASSPHRQGLPDRMGRGMHLPRAAVLRRPRLHPRARHGTAGARCAHHHAVRRHHRHPGAGPDGAQDPAGAGRGPARVPRHGRGVLHAARGRCRARRVRRPLRAKAAEWQQLTVDIGKRALANADEIGAAAYDYLFYSGYVALAYWWARAVAVADASSRPQAFRTPSARPRASTSRACCRARCSTRRRSNRARRRSWRWMPTRSAPEALPKPSREAYKLGSNGA